MTIDDWTELATAVAAVIVAIGTLYNAIIAARHGRSINKVKDQTNGMLGEIRQLAHDRGVTDERQRQSDEDLAHHKKTN